MQTPKPLTLNVEEWEAKAPLSDREIASVGTVRLACEQIPLPSKFDDDDATGSSSRPSTPVGSRLRPHPATPGGISRPNSPMPGYKPLQTHALHPKHAIQTAQQFYDWFALIERSVAHSQEAHFRAHVASVSEHLDTCDRLVERVDEVGLQVDDMLEGWRGVEEGGRSLKDACERLLEERDRLLSLTDEIGARLEYFQELDVATRMLNHPGESLVLQTDFLYMVERVDICIDYLKAHRHFRESEVYLLRFQQCMTRAMTLVRMYFVASLKTLSADISKRMGEKDVSHTAQTHLLYTRFRSVSTHLAPLLGDLERRAASHPAELSALLSECHSAYLSTRKSLLVGRLVQEIRGLDPGRTELVELTRAGCSYLKQLCTDEWSLYQEFFRTGEDMLYQYLETLCDYLYDDLRPRILHEPRLTALCEVCTVLQALMVLDSAGAEVDDDEEDESSEGPISRKSKPRPLHIAHLLSMVLQDAQTRLFFKAQAVIQSDIRYYVPKTDNGDLAWPEAILLDGGAAPLDQQGTWYPTVQKTVWVLEQLRDFVNPAIFEDIAQEAVTLCRQSLVLAADMIKQRPTSEKTNSHDKSTQVPPLPPVLVGTLDGDLFLVRHLLVLKEITHNLDLRLGHFDAGEQDIDRYLYGVGDTLAAILNRTSSLLPGAILASLGMPRTDEGIRDAKQASPGIDHDLKRVCEEIIITCAAAMCDPLRSWLEQVESHNALRASTSTSTKTTPESLAQPAAEALEQSFRKACATELSAAAMRIRLYLGGTSGGSAEVLLAHVRERAIEEYTRFREVVTGMYAGGMRGIVMERAEVRALLDKACSEGMQIKGQ
ncbi:RRM domain-containing protein [Mycena indigotica]|uniref:Conserved oligomeric Golgi complex subunit 3 n=1 Tax=Mycena indigotica TaxID=2126181 RepID=A0A8H6VQG5_9AGAR|nr:RRM domain-containing protein [Mycena indigotica]KAF7289949.1 RRM domain-containing protein [Mycena indigotica]